MVIFATVCCHGNSLQHTHMNEKEIPDVLLIFAVNARSLNPKLKQILHFQFVILFQVQILLKLQGATLILNFLQTLRSCGSCRIVVENTGLGCLIDLLNGNYLCNFLSLNVMNYLFSLFVLILAILAIRRMVTGVCPPALLPLYQLSVQRGRPTNTLVGKTI